jgi:GH15 family glucan-1,4-alpha-glucosidase
MPSELYQRSIQIIQENQDPSGSFVASPSFPTYRYCWIRDGSFIAHAMDLAGKPENARAFYKWVARTILQYAHKVTDIERRLQEEQPLGKDDFLHTRYTLDGCEVTADSAWGNFQVDGYGTWLWALSEHIHLTGDRSFLHEVSQAVDTTLNYLRLVWKLPNYDCWEEHPEYLHPYSLGSVYAGFSSALDLVSTGIFSAPDLTIAECADEVKSFIQKYSIANGNVVKHVQPAIGYEEPEPIYKSGVDSSLIGLAVPFQVFPKDDPAMASTILTIERDLRRHEGGVYRYKSDVYYGGGEWILLSAWLGWYYARAGEKDKATELLNWIESKADLNGNLPEQVNEHALYPHHYQPWIDKWGPVASPLLWSHAMYIILAKELER